MKNEDIFSNKIDELSTLIEEASRASKQNISRFIEPAQGTLRRAKSKRHHIIFGRRGSGKSSLILKTADTLSEEGNPISFIDLEPFKGHQYPDIIISVLIATFMKYKIWLENKGDTLKKKRIWYLPWMKKKKINNNIYGSLIKEINGLIESLEEQLYLSDNSKLIEKVKKITDKEDISKTKGKASVNYKQLCSSDIEKIIANTVKSTNGKEIHEEHRRSKIEFLLKEILKYQHTLSKLVYLTKKDCFIFLDDLYHILRKDQANLIDYFHRIAKGNRIWLKIGTIRNRSSWYIHSPQPIGLKIGDDADEINLDLTLEKFAISKSFLKKILNLYIDEVNAPKLKNIVADTGIDRLVISSGGVARDFLGLFRKSIDETRERLKRQPNHARGEKIGAQDVNLASGAYGELKKEEFKIDTSEDETKLESEFNNILIFCLVKTKKNIFLIDQDLKGKTYDSILELIDLRLIHQVKSRITVNTKPGKIFRALLLDVSQYTGERARRDVEMIEFWKDSNKEVLRKASLIYSSDDTYTKTEATNKITSKKNYIKKDRNIEDENQLKFDI